MMRYLGVTMTPGTSGIEICCATEAEAQSLAHDLNLVFDLRDEQKMEANDGYEDQTHV